MNKGNKPDFDSYSDKELLRLYRRRFRWLRRRHMGFLRKGITFGRTCSNSLTEHYWVHLPRWVYSIGIMYDILEQYASADRVIRILDLGTSPPYAALRAACLEEYDACVHYTYGTMSGETHSTESSLGQWSAETVSVRLGQGHLPFDQETFDIVLFEEVLEHLDDHPQEILVGIAEIIKMDGLLYLTTPNVLSWKKIYRATNGIWDYDSPTFGGEYGHRYEYSHYQVRELLRRSGFLLEMVKTINVYFDDKLGWRAKAQYAGTLFLKLLTGEWRSMIKMLLRSGSGMFLLARRTGATQQSELMDI